MGMNGWMLLFFCQIFYKKVEEKERRYNVSDIHAISFVFGDNDHVILNNFFFFRLNTFVNKHDIRRYAPL